jgi:hypothetical protein
MYRPHTRAAPPQTSQQSGKPILKIWNSSRLSPSIPQNIVLQKRAHHYCLLGYGILAAAGAWKDFGHNEDFSLAQFLAGNAGFSEGVLHQKAGMGSCEHKTL